MTYDVMPDAPSFGGCHIKVLAHWASSTTTYILQHCCGICQSQLDTHSEFAVNTGPSRLPHFFGLFFIFLCLAMHSVRFLTSSVQQTHQHPTAPVTVTTPPSRVVLPTILFPPLAHKNTSHISTYHRTNSWVPDFDATDATSLFQNSEGNDTFIVPLTPHISSNALHRT